MMFALHLCPSRWLSSVQGGRKRREKERLKEVEEALARGEKGRGVYFFGYCYCYFHAILIKGRSDWMQVMQALAVTGSMKLNILM